MHWLLWRKHHLLGFPINIDKVIEQFVKVPDSLYDKINYDYKGA